MKIEELESGQGLDGVSGTLDRAPSRTGWRRGGSWALRLATLVLVVAAAVWAYYANVSAARPTMDMSMRIAAGSIPFPVTLVPPERGPITGAVTYTGSVAAFNEEDVFPRVMGRIVAMPVYPGDAVRAGQVVARLDDVELGSKVREAAAGAAAAQANAAQMDADVTAARHGVVQMERELAMATAELRAARDGIAQMEKELAMVEADAGYQESVSARDEKLFTSGAVSRQDVENARAMVASARAKVAATRAKVSQMSAMATAAEAKLEAGRARLDQARAMETSAVKKRDAMAAMATQSVAMQRTAEIVRDYVDIRSPSGGYVVKRLVAPGVLVMPGMAILKIAQIDKVRLQANVGEKDLASIKVGSPVRVTTTSTATAPVTARVTSVFPFVEQGPRTAVVEAIVENAGRRFLPGQYVQMEFVTGSRADAISVPPSALVRMGGKARVWLAQDGRADSRDVVTGLENAERVEITQGLTGTERVIARGHEGLYAGARVSDVGRSTPAMRSGTGAREGMPGMTHEPAPPSGGDAHKGMPGMSPGLGTAPAPSAPAKTEAPTDPHKGMPGMK